MIRMLESKYNHQKFTFCATDSEDNNLNDDWQYRCKGYGRYFARESLSLLLTCKESKELYLENYTLLGSRIAEGTARLDSPHWVDMAYLDKSRDTVIMAINSCGSFQGSAEIPAPFDLVGLRNIAFIDMDSGSSIELQLVSEIIAKVKTIRSVDLLMGCWWVSDKVSREPRFRYQFMEVSKDIRHLRFDLTGLDNEGALYELGKLERDLKRADRLRRKQTEQEQLDEKLWKGVKTHVSTMVKVKGTSYVKPHRHCLNLIPKQPAYSGVHFYMDVYKNVKSNGQQSRNDSEIHYLETANWRPIECLFDGTLVPSWDNFDGVANLMDGNFLLASSDGDLQDIQDNSGEGLTGLDDVE